MRLSSIALFASTATAISFSGSSIVTNYFSRRDGHNKCPAIWNTISKDLTSRFLANGQCNPDARAAIRAIFHDCGAWNTAQGAKGGCDGSLAIAPGEIDRSENKGLANIIAMLKNMANTYNVGVADMIVFAGNHAIVTCPGGPRVQTYIGRTDSTTPAPNGLLPDVNADPAALSRLFTDKGFSDRDLAALLGAHSTSNQFHFDTSTANVGASQDSTPGVWDVKYYSETLNPPKGIVVFPSDSKLAQYKGVGKEFNGFVNNAGKWNGKFADAMAKMALFGSGNTKNMADCTDSLPKTTNAKRELKAINPFMPRY
ncbi:heme peroxidase [Massarina eburnea CBS 473.64]|uniref:Peroxidase n=1 Tax=Massarina eburnea CBS 473.64 TaxID=1395130 RepID=A0A6A6SJH3_9PLEO|nr:heme peroxidase [Massarina eburnea CBS 473.64]